MDNEVPKNGRKQFGVATRLARLETEVSQIGESLGELSKHIRLIGQPKWGPLASGIGVLLVVVSLVGGIISYTFNRELDHAAKEAERLAKSVIDLDTKLQREMNLIAARIDSEAAAVNKASA